MDEYRVLFLYRRAGGSYVNMMEFTHIDELELVRRDLHVAGPSP